MTELITENQDKPIERIIAGLETNNIPAIRSVLATLQSGEIAHLLESLPPNERNIVWSVVDADTAGCILVDLGDEVRNGLVEQMGASEILLATASLETDDLADFFQNLPTEVTEQILQLMDQNDLERLQSVLHYEEDSAGGLMNTDTVTVRTNVTVDVVLRYLRQRGKLPEHTDSLFVVDRNEHYIGLLPLSVLLTSPITKAVKDIVDRDAAAIAIDLPSNEVAHLFEARDLVSAAVIDNEGTLLGRITVDDVVDVIRDEADKNLLGHAGLNEDDDIFSPVFASTKRRALWLGLNLATAFLASWVIGNFQGTLEKVVALAVLMPIVASMGGIAGTQTMTLVIRGFALGQISAANSKWLLLKEISVGFFNGMIWAVVVAVVTIIWFKDLRLGGIIAAAMAINLLIAALSGVLIPLILRKLRIDPALAGGVVLTTVTDVTGFLVFLGLATIVLH